jgi:hypothetical protein
MVKKKLHSGPGIVLGLPTLGRPVSLDWAFAFKSMNPPINYNVHFHVVKGKEIGYARNEIVKFALKADAKYLFFLGDDVIVPAHGLRQLIYRLEMDNTIGVVGGVYCSKCDPAAPLVFNGNGQGSYWDWKVGEFFPVSGLGMDCTLIRTDVFENLPEPWFVTVDKDQYLDGINNCEQWTEDLYFLKNVKEQTAWRIYCDATVICGHVDVYNDRIYTLPPGSPPMRMKATFCDKTCLVIGPPTGTQLEGYDVCRIGEDNEADYRGVPTSLPFESGIFDRVIITAPSYVISEANRVAKPGALVEMITK